MDSLRDGLGSFDAGSSGTAVEKPASVGPVSRTVYLLHFHAGLSELDTKRHYTGITTNLGQRILSHSTGAGARFTYDRYAAGIGFVVVAIWPDAEPSLERKVKHAARHLCPLCERAGPRPYEALKARAVFWPTVTLDWASVSD